MKNVFKFLLVVSPIILIAQGATSKSFVHTLQLQERPKEVWNVITDFSTFSLWDNGVVDINCPDVLSKNKRCQVITESGKIFEVEIVEWIENQSYTVRHKLSSGNLYIKRTINTVSGVELTETVWYTGLSKRNFEKYKGSDYQNVLQNRMLEFKKYLEEDLVDRK